jgi:hypothetical protein
MLANAWYQFGAVRCFPLTCAAATLNNRDHM